MSSIEFVQILKFMTEAIFENSAIRYVAVSFHQVEPNTRLTEIPKWPSVLSLAVSRLTFLVRASGKYTKNGSTYSCCSIILDIILINGR